MDDWIFKKEPRLIRTLSDGIVNRKRVREDEPYYYEHLDRDGEVEFLKIDSNYNEAIQEVYLKITQIIVFFKKNYF